jgi:hypothetical protein
VQCSTEPDQAETDSQNAHRKKTAANPRHIKEDRIEVAFKEIGCFGAD